MDHSITSRVRSMNMDQRTEFILNEVRQQFRFENSDARSQQVFLCLENRMILQILETEQIVIEDRIHQRSAYYLFLRDALNHHPSTCCGECRILFRRTVAQQKQEDEAEDFEVARANVITTEPLVSIDMNDVKEIVNLLVEDELSRMKAACLEMQQRLRVWPLPERRNIVSRSTLRRQDQELAQGLRPDVADEVDGFVIWRPLHTRRHCFNCGSAIDSLGSRIEIL